MTLSKEVVFDSRLMKNLKVTEMGGKFMQASFQVGMDL